MKPIGEPLMARELGDPGQWEECATCHRSRRWCPIVTEASGLVQIVDARHCEICGDVHWGNPMEERTH